MVDSQSRRWLQFRLRTLLIAILVLSLPLSWLAMKMENARKQREAAAIVEKAGGRVTYNPARARAISGNDVVAVDLTRVEFGDDKAACFENLTGLVVLTIDHCQVTDTGLEHLDGLVNLKSLSLRKAPITAAGLEHLKGMVNLQILSPRHDANHRRRA